MKGSTARTSRRSHHLLGLGVILSVLCIWLLVFTTGATTTDGDLRVVSQNLNRFFDDRDDGNNEKILSSVRYRQRIEQLVERIDSEYHFADIIALQEVENIRILRDVVSRLKKQYRVNYVPLLMEGNDQSGIDVGFLVKASLQIEDSRSLFADHTYGAEKKPLFARPPLALTLCRSDCVTIVNLHLRSMRGLRSRKDGERVALKRRLQAETIARWVQRKQTTMPAARIMLIGDFNALTPADRYVDSVGIIRGDPDNDRPRWKSTDLIERDLVDITARVPSGRRYSFLYRKRKQQLDYLLTSANLADDVSKVAFSRIDFSFSDHAAILAIFRLR